MKFSFNQSTLQGVLRQRDLALWSCLGLTVINFILAVKVVSSEEHWVFIPQHDIDHRISVTSNTYSDEYFIDWANGVVNTLLCVNSDSVDWKTQQTLKITTEKHGNLKEKLTQEAELIKKDKISTVFYPKNFTVNKSQQTVAVVGQHIAYFGKDSVPVMTEKTYQLAWVVRMHGIVLLKDFKELKDE